MDIQLVSSSLIYSVYLGQDVILSVCCCLSLLFCAHHIKLCPLKDSCVTCPVNSLSEVLAIHHQKRLNNAHLNGKGDVQRLACAQTFSFDSPAYKK